MSKNIAAEAIVELSEKDMDAIRGAGESVAAEFVPQRSAGI